jgi:hypothetical protein
MQEFAGPAYDTGLVRERFRTGRYVLPGRVKRYLRARGWDEDFVCLCALSLNSGCFHKTMPHDNRPGIWLDVYRPWVGGVRMYVKLTLHENDEDILLLSLCIDGTAH